MFNPNPMVQREEDVYCFVENPDSPLPHERCHRPPGHSGVHSVFPLPGDSSLPYENVGVDWSGVAPQNEPSDAIAAVMADIEAAEQALTPQEGSPDLQGAYRKAVDAAVRLKQMMTPEAPVEEGVPAEA